MMTAAAARSLREGDTCFVGIGLPSTAANLARRTHAPNLVLIYESGTLGAKPDRLPLSIGDGDPRRHGGLGGRRPRGVQLLAAGRAASTSASSAGPSSTASRNINTTVIGDDYDHPKVRLPGAGGAPEIAASCRRSIIIMRQSQRSFVDRVDFVTSFGFGRGPGDRERLGLRGRGRGASSPTSACSSPTAPRCELTLTATHPGVTVDQVRAATGWPLAVADDVITTDVPSENELRMLRELQETAEGHSMTDIFVLDAVRTPIGRYGGALPGCVPTTSPPMSSAPLVDAVAGTRPGTIDDVWFGDANGAGEDNRDVARMAGCSRACRRRSPA